MVVSAAPGTVVLEIRVAPVWIDYNGHMNDAAYARVFSLAVDALMDRVGLGAAARAATGRTLYTLQIMLHYVREAKLGDTLAVAARVLELDSKGRQWLADKGYDPSYGARPLKRVIQKAVQDPLAQMLLAGEIRDGAEIKIGASHGALTVNGKTYGAAAEAETGKAGKPATVVNFPKGS